MPQNTTCPDPALGSLSRRGFMAGASAATLTILKPELVRGSQANSAISLGMIACGNRAKWIGNLFMKHGGYRIAAASDYFQDRVDELGRQFQVEPGRHYTGLAGHKSLLDAKPDAVVIESPPYFHPEQAMAAVEAGCHVFLAKPIAVDVPGCLTVGEAGKKATEKKLTFLVDFQTRANPIYQEAVRRVHARDIGPIVNGEAMYFCGPTWKFKDVLAADPKNPELRLRAWGLDRTLSGDVITEQNIHALDVATWILDAHPVKAYGTGGRQGRDDLGDCWGNFAVIYYFPNDVVVNFTSKQVGTGYNDIGCRVYGTQGTVDTHYAGLVSIKGEKPFPEQSTGNLFTDGVVKNIADFHQAVTSGDCSNRTVAPSVRSNLTTVLGRTAAYRQAEVTWDEVMKAGEKWQFEGVRALKA